MSEGFAVTDVINLPMLEYLQDRQLAGDVVDFSWDDERHIRPLWSDRVHPTIIIPSTQKNGRQQEVPMLPGLCELLKSIPPGDRCGWVVNPLTKEHVNAGNDTGYRPNAKDLRRLAESWSNCSIAKACGVSEASVRGWLIEAGFCRADGSLRPTGPIPAEVAERIRQGAAPAYRRRNGRFGTRMTKERVGRIISMIGEAADVVVIREDASSEKRRKFASAHDLRRGCAQRLINAGVSAETLKVVMRHHDFATTERHYGATRSAQAAASEVQEKLATDARKGALLGGLKEPPRFTAEEVQKLKCLLDSL